jgi:hypothetical protein
LEADATIRAKMDEARVTGHSDAAADRILTVECSSERDVAAAVAQLQDAQAWKDLADPETIKFTCYQLLYSIAK